VARPWLLLCRRGVIQDYDPRWPALYEVELGRVLTALQEEIVVETQHVGSTAVPGLAAKPTIDIRLLVR